MKKLSLLALAIALVSLVSCSQETLCPHGKVTGKGLIQDVYYIYVDGKHIPVNKTTYDRYPKEGVCWEY